MASKTKTPLAAGLDAIERGPGGGTIPKVLQMFGDQPDVLDAIERARRDRKLSYGAIAKYFRGQGHDIGEGAIKKWLDSRGID